METLNYYRGYELLSDEQVSHLEKIWGKSGYNYIEKLPLDGNTRTGLVDVSNLLYTIWNTEHLNIREQEIIERIKKGTKPSKARFSGKYPTVEGNMLFKLICEAENIYNESVDIEDKLKSYNLGNLFVEFCRLYGLKYESVMDKVAESEDMLFKYGELRGKYVEYTGKRRVFNDKVVYRSKEPCSAYHCDFIELGNSLYSFSYDSPACRKMCKEIPFLGKAGFFKGWGNASGGTIQIYHYDYGDADNNLQMIINYLIENEYICEEYVTKKD